MIRRSVARAQVVLVACLLGLICVTPTASADEGTITEFPTPGGGPAGITAGPGASLWFAEAGSNQIARRTSSGAFTEFAVPTPGSQPYGVTTGPDGNLWFTEASGNKIGRMT